jgi:hypothetical protein
MPAQAVVVTVEQGRLADEEIRVAGELDEVLARPLSPE